MHLELADNLGKAAVEFRTGLMSTMKSVMSTVKRAAGYEEDQQQAEQLANEMIQVKNQSFLKINKIQSITKFKISTSFSLQGRVRNRTPRL